MNAREQQSQDQRLDAIIDAILDAQHDLKTASGRQFTQILVESCRRRKNGPDQIAIVTSC